MIVGRVLLGAILGVSVGAAAFSAGCSSKSAPATAYSLTTAELQDPQSCQGCHDQHYSEWSGSMHAYASDDPVFRAMNQRAQRETNGAVGDFCVRCHAPLAAQLGLTKNGLDLDRVPASMHGITCFFCHSVDAVNGTNDNPLHLATDGVLRAAIADPQAGHAHAATYSALHDRARPEASQLCGACHDVTLPSGVPIESTFAEWQGSLYAHDSSTTLLTCQACHMPGSDGAASSLPGSPARRVYDHSVPGVDLALTDFPNLDLQKALVQANLDPAVVTKLCVTPPGSGDPVAVTLDAAFVGHDWPSGAVHDRRAWLEVIAYKGSSIVFESGVVAPGENVTTKTDPNLWLFREKLLDPQGQEVKMMWQAATTIRTSLGPALTNDPTDPRYVHSVTKTYPVPASADRVTVRVLIQPFGLEIVGDLIASGDLDASYETKLTTFQLAGTAHEWTSARGFGCVP